MPVEADLDKEFGYRLRHARMLRGLSQMAFGSLVGISYQQVQKYETGANRISSGRLYEICRVLRLSVTYFYKDLDTTNALTTVTPENEPTDQDIRAAVKLVELPNGPKKDALFVIIKAIIEENAT